MIAKMKSNLSTRETLLYNDREKSEIIFINNLTGDNVHDVERQMVARQKLFSGRAKNLIAHIIISPSIDDSKRQTRLDWKKIGNSFLLKADLSAYQSIAYLHKDKEHLHLHIVVNRIDAKGRIYRNGNELVMSQRIGDEIATERGLKRAAEIRRERMASLKNGIARNSEIGSVAQIRKNLSNAATIAWRSGKFEPAKYFEHIKSKGYEVRLFFKKDKEGNNTEELRGYAVGEKGEHFLNASQFGSEFTIRRLIQEIPIKSGQSESNINSEIDNIKIRKDLNECFDKLIDKYKKFDSKLFLQEVRAKGYSVKEYFNKDTDRLRGYGIEIDNAVHNASEIGSEFTLTNLQKRFNESIFSEVKATSPSRKKKASKNPIIEENAPDSSDQISKELKKTIDLSFISNDLRDLTSGRKYQSHQDFIQALEEKGYHVHLRYHRGELSGYTIHKGIEHYHDTEIDNGRFSLSQLNKTGMFRGTEIKDFYSLKKSSLHAKGVEVENIVPKHPLVSDDKLSGGSLIDSKMGHEQKRKKEDKVEREEARRVMAGELKAHLQFLKAEGDLHIAEKFFS